MDITLLKIALLAAVITDPSLLVAGEIHEAVKSGNPLAVQRVIETKGIAELEDTLPGGVTALHLAAALNLEPVAALLCQKGADLERVSEGGFTPLHWAAGRDAEQTAELLIQMGADISRATDNGLTPLHWAAENNSTNVLRLLLVSGASTDVVTTKGLKPIHYAVRSKSSESALLLAYKMVDDMATNALSETSGSSEEQTNRIAGSAGPDATDAGIGALRETHLPDGLRTGDSLTVFMGRDRKMEFVWIPAVGLWVGKHEVTNTQFQRFMPTHESGSKTGISLDQDDCPVVRVSWDDAIAFCARMSTYCSDQVWQGWHFRLPTDGEWTQIARCGDGRPFPWGESWPPLYGNYGIIELGKGLLGLGTRLYNDGYAATCPVQESGENDWGICGMGGNVWEWCLDWYSSSKRYKVRKGGGWGDIGEASLRIDAVGFDRPSAKYETIGFRVVMAPE